MGLMARWSQELAEEPGYLTFQQSNTNPTMTNPHNSSDGDDRQIGQFNSHFDATLAEDIFWSVKGYVNTFDDKRFVRFSENVSQQERLVEEIQYGAITTLTYRPAIDWLDDFSFEAGFDIQQQDNKSARYLTDDRIRTTQTRQQTFDLQVYGGYLQAMIKPFKWLRITPGFRADVVDGNFSNDLNSTSAKINDYGTIWQPKFGAVITPFEGYSLYGNWGRTFQIAIGAASYLIPPRTANLDPSINEGWEVGIKLQPASWLESRIAYWQQSATDEWGRDLNNPNNDSINIGATNRQGVDAQVRVSPVDFVDIWGAFSLQEAIIETDGATKGNKIDHTPDYIFSGGIDYWVNEKLKASLWTTGQGGYYLDQANTQGKLGDYALLNLNLNYQVLQQVELQFQAKNLTDTYWEYVWYDGTQTLHSPGDGISFYGAIKVNFDL